MRAKSTNEDGRDREAIRLAEELEAKYPGDGTMLDEAIAAGERCLEIGSYHVREHCLVYLQLALEKRATESWRQAWVRHNDPDHRYSRQAIADFNRLDEIMGKKIPRRMRCNCYIECGDTARAIAEADQLVKVDPNRAEHYILRGRCYLEATSFDNAITDATRALELASKVTYQDISDRCEAFVLRWRANEAKGDQVAAARDRKLWEVEEERRQESFRSHS